jgi:hypothetical protein
MASRLIAATAVLLLALASAKIIDINDEDPSTWSYHVHTETLFKAPSNNSKYPFIQLEGIVLAALLMAFSFHDSSCSSMP